MWLNVSPPLNEPFDVIAADPANPLIVLAGSDTGLYSSKDDAASRIKGSGLLNAPISDVKINQSTGQTVVFTWGRRAYQVRTGVPSGSRSGQEKCAPLAQAACG